MFIFINIILILKIIFLGSGGQENDILLEAPDSVISHIEEIHRSLIEPVSKSFERSINHTFVSEYTHPDFYLSRCFPSLYPYGRGCPSDKQSLFLSKAKYAKHMLCLGGGPQPRRFQQSSKFIFTMYTMEMRRKIGGVAYVAQRKNLDGSEEVSQEPPNIADINKLLHYLGDTPSLDKATNATNSDMVTNQHISPLFKLSSTLR